LKEEKIKSIIESFLFVWGEPLDIKLISKTLELSPAYVRKVIIDMKNIYEKENRGIQIIEVNNKFQLSTNKENYEYIQKLCTPPQNKGLTQAALEVVSIIAYKQPITRPEIEAIRGVKSDKAITTLVDRNLICENGRLDKPGKPILYITTDEFLRSFGINNLESLPTLEDEEMGN
jgi:segregation and condensation protein B